MLIHNKVYNHRKKQRRQLERERLAKKYETIKKPKKLESCRATEVWLWNLRLLNIFCIEFKIFKKFLM